MIRLLVASAILAGSFSLAQAEEHSFWWRTRAQAACIKDVIRLCHSAMPDQDKVTDCMKDKKDQVSEGCASFYPGGSNAE